MTEKFEDSMSIDAFCVTHETQGVHKGKISSDYQEGRSISIPNEYLPDVSEHPGNISPDPLRGTVGPDESDSQRLCLHCGWSKLRFPKSIDA